MYNFGLGSACSSSKQCLCKNKKIPNFNLYRKENTCLDYMINYADCNIIRRRYKYYTEITNITDASLPRGCLIKHTGASGPDMNNKEGQFYFNSEYTTVNCGHKDSNDDYWFCLCDTFNVCAESPSYETCINNRVTVQQIQNFY